MNFLFQSVLHIAVYRYKLVDQDLPTLCSVDEFSFLKIQNQNKRYIRMGISQRKKARKIGGRFGQIKRRDFNIEIDISVKRVQNTHVIIELKLTGVHKDVFVVLSFFLTTNGEIKLTSTVYYHNLTISLTYAIGPQVLQLKL